jgi:hypothetical protein
VRGNKSVSKPTMQGYGDEEEGTQGNGSVGVEFELRLGEMFVVDSVGLSWESRVKSSERA